jgi:HD-GYP domain-containing protein (c-di-GMP phosphodiesterase class II)
MRLVEFNDLSEEMTLAHNVYGLTGEVLAKKGNIVSSKLKSRLSSYNIPYLYINDCCSEDISVQCAVHSSIRNEATQNIKKLYAAILSRNTTSYPQLMQNCLASVDKIVNDIISQKIDLYDVFDIKLVENYSYQHPVNVMIISLIIGKDLNLNALELYKLGIGAFLFDVGKMFIPKDILYKTGKYSDAEYKLMQTHTRKGYDFAKEEFYLPMKSYLAILQHHERYDGAGYPTQKAGKEISEFGRIVAIADVYDALTSKRDYREAMPPAFAFKTVIQEANKAFDPDFIKVFLRRVSPYPVGLTLTLADGRKGVVYKNYLGNPFSPSIKIIQEAGQKLSNPYIETL